MTKVRASGADDPLSKRQHAADVVKPPGFRKPDHRPALSRAILDAESRCEGHVAAWHDGRVCGRCGTHVNSLI
jgi:hypothetical protein